MEDRPTEDERSEQPANGKDKSQMASSRRPQKPLATLGTRASPVCLCTVADPETDQGGLNNIGQKKFARWTQYTNKHTSIELDN